MAMSIQRLAKQVENLTTEFGEKQEIIQSLDTVCKIRKSATTPFYYYYTEVWKDWFEKK
jgi:hypothetical protein